MVESKKGKSSVYKHMVRGSAWAVAMRWGIRAIGLVSVVILARLLTPDDFGVLATGSLTIGFIGGFADLGVQMLLIRDQDAGREHADTAWTIGILQGVLVAVVLIIISPLAGKYFGEDRVVAVIAILALSAVFEGAQNIGMVLARKELDFSRDFRFHIYVRIASFFVTIALAYFLRSYWALVWAQVITSILSVPLSYLMHPYRPRLCLQEASRYIKFASSIIPLRVGRFLNGKVDAIIVGGIATTTQLGVYNIASDVSAMLTKEILTPIGRGLMPNYSKLNKEPEKLAAAYCQVLSACGTIVFPFGFGLWAVAKEFVVIVLGDQWDAAVPIVEMLSLYFMLTGLLHMMSSQILIASGHEKRSALLMWARLLILIPFLMIASRLWGFEGIAPTTVAAAVTALPIVVITLTRSMQLTIGSVIVALWRPLIAAVSMAMTVRFSVSALEFAPTVTILIEVAVGIISYFGILLLLWMLSGRPVGLERVAIEYFKAKISGRARD